MGFEPTTLHDLAVGSNHICVTQIFFRVLLTFNIKYHRQKKKIP